MAEIFLRCEKCGKVQGFKDMEEVAKKGWVIHEGKYGEDTALCPECKGEKQLSYLFKEEHRGKL